MLRATSSFFPSRSPDDEEDYELSVRRSSLAVDIYRRMQVSDSTAPLVNSGGRDSVETTSPQTPLDYAGLGRGSSLRDLEGYGYSAQPAFSLGVNRSGRNKYEANNKGIEDLKDEDYDPSGFIPPSNPPTAEEEMSTLYFRDGMRKIDFVLAYEDGDFRKKEWRKMFQENLKKEGMQMELEDKTVSQDGKTYFLKLHAPPDILKKHAEVLNMKKPIKNQVDNEQSRLECHLPVRLSLPFSRHLQSFRERKRVEGTTLAWGDEEEVQTTTYGNTFCGSFNFLFSYDRQLIPDDLDVCTCNGSRSRDEQSDTSSKDNVFTDAQRSRIVWEILIRTPYHSDGRASTGILYLVSNGTYTAAYPLHDGPYGKGAFRPEEEEPNERRLLYSEWARAACWYKIQPLVLIRKYFGEKTSLYFAWLGFYTTMLIPAAGLGLLTMIYGVSTMHTNIPSKEICDADGPGDVAMCPQCDRRCDYWQLKEGCVFSKIVHLFDNPATVGFAVFMSLWATMFMEFWKRKQATLAWEWSLSDLDYGMEQIRPEYETTVNSYRLNPVTMSHFPIKCIFEKLQSLEVRFPLTWKFPNDSSVEPFLPIWSKVSRMAGANSAVLLVLSLLLAAVFGMIVYRIILVTVLTASDHMIWHKYAKITTSITASVLNLIVIVIMDKVYRVLAAKLTNLEQPRTQREYEDSFTFKMFLFEFINMYSSLIYIAFFKGRFFGHPGDTFTLFGYRQDQCELGGCLFEVCVQLAIIMVGKQILNNISELSWAEIMNWWRRWWRARDGPKNRIATTRWEKDYNLQECDRMALFDEYLEMVIQFGFVTLFVAAFPLAPLFALLNNIVEIRLDAYKYVTQLRRPLTARVPNIGAWQAILKGISVFAVITNAFMIAYTSDFIPRLVYVFVYSKDRSLSGYINNSLSYFNVEDFTNDTLPESPHLGENLVTVCRYQDYRHPPDSPDKYKLNMKYWHIFAARLSFVVVFEHLVFFVTGLLAYLIPDIPRSVQQKIQRQRFLAREALYRSEAEENGRDYMEAVDGDGAALPC